MGDPRKAADLCLRMLTRKRVIRITGRTMNSGNLCMGSPFQRHQSNHPGLQKHRVLVNHMILGKFLIVATLSCLFLLDGIGAWIGDIWVDICKMEGYENPDNIRYSMSFFQPKSERGMEMVAIRP